MALYPPILPSSIAPVIGKKIEFYVELSNFVSSNDITGIELKIHDANNHQNMLSASQSQNRLKISDLSLSNSKYKIEKDIEKLVYGNLYKVQARFYQEIKTDKTTSFNYSEWSNVMIFKAIKQCEVEIKNNSLSRYSSITSIYKAESSETPLFFGSCTTGINDNEDVDKYQFILYNATTGEEIESSGWLQHFNFNLDNNNLFDRHDTQAVLSYDKHRFNTVLSEDHYYQVVYKVKTINGFEATSSVYHFTIALKELPSIDNGGGENSCLYIIDGEDDPEKNENACIEIRLFISDERLLTGNFILSRSSEKSNFQKWEDIKYFYFTSESSFSNENSKKGYGALLYTDFTVESGVRYQYAFQLENSLGFRSSRIVEMENHKYSKKIGHISNFEHVYLYNNNSQLKLKFNTKISSVKNNVLASKQDTLGSKYPTIVRNGMTYYKEFPINGTISIQMDDNENFFYVQQYYDLMRAQDVVGYYYKNELVIPFEKCFSKINDKRNPCNPNPQYEDENLVFDNGYVQHLTSNLTENNFFIERVFREKVEEFLNNGEAKLFKSAAEGNVSVVLMNVSLTPNQQLGRMIYDFSATAYEICGIDIASLDEYGISVIGKFIGGKDTEDFYITGQIEGIINGKYTKDRNPSGNNKPSASQNTSADNIVDLIKNQIAIDLGYSYTYAFNDLLCVWFEQYPKLNYQNEISGLDAQIHDYKNLEAIELVSYEEEIESLNAQKQRYEDIVEAVAQEALYTYIPLEINDQPVYVSKNKKYEFRDIENITSIYLHYTQPIVINYIVKVNHAEIREEVVESIESAKLHGQLAGMFTNKPKTLASYNALWDSHHKQLTVDGYKVLHPDSSNSSIPYTSTNLYSTLNLKDVLDQDVRQQIEKIYSEMYGNFIFTKVKKNGKYVWQYRDAQNREVWSFNVVDYKFIEIETTPGIHLSYYSTTENNEITKREIIIGNTGKYLFKDLDNNNNFTITFEKPTHAIINYCITTVQSKTQMQEQETLNEAVTALNE